MTIFWIKESKDGENKKNAKRLENAVYLVAYEAY
jgi:hypothetical protein